MLLAKWATLVSFVDTGQVALIVLLAFGSRRHVHVLGQVAGQALRHRRLSRRTWRSRCIRASGRPSWSWPCSCSCGCVWLPIISCSSSWNPTCTACSACSARTSPRQPVDRLHPAAFIAVVLFAGLGRSKAKKVEHLPGRREPRQRRRAFSELAVGRIHRTARNWYLEGIFGEKRIVAVSARRAAPSSSSLAFAVAAVAFRDCSRKGCDLT